VSRLPGVVVPHGRRSLPVLQLAEGAAGLCRPIWLVDPADPDAVASRRLLERLGPIVTTDRPFAALVADLAAAGAEAAIAFRDADLGLVARLADALGLRFHSPEVADLLTDKLAQRQALAAAGLPTPAVAHIPDPTAPSVATRLAGTVRFPAVLKPRRGSGSRQTVLVARPADLATTLAELDRTRPAHRGGGAGEPMILEEYLPSTPGAAEGPFADYVSVETVATTDGLVHVAVTGRTPTVAPFRETGFFLPSHLDEDQTAAVLATAGAALSALGVTTGCTHTEIKLTPDGPRILEVNGRMGGGIRDLLLAASGRDLLVDDLRSALGLPVELHGLVTCQKVGYRLFYQPPLVARRLVALDGLRELAEIPGVLDVTPHLSPGEPVDPRQGTRAFLFSVVGAVDDHRDVARARRRLEELVEARYELADGTAVDDGPEGVGDGTRDARRSAAPARTLAAR
jgi:biotin carboxylase